MTRADLHRLIDDLPDDALGTVAELVAAVHSAGLWARSLPPLSPELQAIFEAEWAENQDAYWYLADR